MAALQERIAAGPAPADASQAQVLALLETKLRVRQALSAEPLASRYPGLYEELEKYLDAYGQEQRQEGQAGALQDAAAVLEGLARASRAWIRAAWPPFTPAAPAKPSAASWPDCGSI